MSKNVTTTLNVTFSTGETPDCSCRFICKYSFLLVVPAPMNINSSFIRRHALLHSTILIFNYRVYFGLNRFKIDTKYDLFTDNLFTI